MKKEDLKEELDQRIAAVSGLDTWELEGELSADFGQRGDQIAEWIREFAVRQLEALRDWAEEAE